MKNKKMSEIHKKWLLVARLLTLIFLIIAFAQPYFSAHQINKESISIIYIDNSLSSNYRNAQMTILDQAKKQAYDWIETQEGNEFILITNDNLYNDNRLSSAAIKQAINNIKPETTVIFPNQLHAALTQLADNNFSKQLNIIVFSDLQASTWTHVQNSKNLNNKSINYFFFPLRSERDKSINLAVASSFIADMPNDATQSATLITTLKKYGEGEATQNLDISINGQTKSSKKIEWNSSDSIKYDTTYFPLSVGIWNKIKIQTNHPNATWDNNYFMAAKASSSNNVLILSPTTSSPYLTSAINATSGANAVIQNFNSETVNNSRGKYPLIIFDNVTTLSEDEVSAIKGWNTAGQAVAIFFARNANITQLNTQLKKIGPISIKNIDTTLQQTVDLQSSHPLLQNVLAQIPDNVQLPFSQYAYKLQLGINAAPQPVIKFRDGAPFFVQLSMGLGKLYLCASPLSEESTSFVTSHYFAPIVSKMLSNNASANVYSVEIGQREPIWLRAVTNDDKQIFHLKNNDWEAVPVQQSYGLGTNIFVPENVPDEGHFLLTNGNQQEEIWIGVNNSRIESDLTGASPSDLSKVFNPKNTFTANNATQFRALTKSGSSFPLWKIALIMALCWLTLETYLLTRKK